MASPSVTIPHHQTRMTNTLPEETKHQETSDSATIGPKSFPKARFKNVQQLFQGSSFRSQAPQWRRCPSSTKSTRSPSAPPQAKGLGHGPARSTREGGFFRRRGRSPRGGSLQVKAPGGGPCEDDAQHVSERHMKCQRVTLRLH